MNESDKDFYIIYPDRRYVSNHRMEVWYLDAVDNGQVEPIHDSIGEKAYALHDAGLITLANTPQ